MTQGQLETTIAALAATLGGVHPGRFDPSAPFVTMGLDSIALVELAAAIEGSTGFDLAPEVLADCGNAHTLAARLLSSREAAPDGRIATVDPIDGMLNDSTLPPDVRPPGSRACNAGSGQSAATGRSRQVSAGGLRDAGTVLLTGATGFLGRWIARTLLDTSSATLICIVREGSSDASARLNRSLARAGVSEDQRDRRVQLVEGDLALPRLGLDDEALADLARRVDAICHAGAAVNWIHSYAALRAANVLGTLELLRLACLQGCPFHFVSSISVCYSTAAPCEVDERFDPVCGSRPASRPHLKGLHLGYARTKAVAEALVRQAGDRGLPVTIHRPALISGHSQAMDFNADDLMSILVRGCVEMEAAPDLDWTLDALPVEAAARRIVDLSASRGTYHLVHPRPRHWRECVLWMRMYGYRLTVRPFGAWLQQMEREVEAAARAGRVHPLARIRRFFAERPAGGGGLSRAQLYEDVRRTRALSARTDGHLQQAPAVAELDATLLDHYFAAFRSDGLPAPDSPIGVALDPQPFREPADPSRFFDVQFFSRAACNTLGAVSGATILSRGSRHSIVSDLTAWRSRRPTGLFEYRLATAGGRSHDVVLKVKPRDRDVMAAGEALARVCDASVGNAYARWQDRIGFAQAHTREIAIYRQPDRRFGRHLPRLLGSICDESAATWALVLERIADADRLDGSVPAAGWDSDAIATAIAGLAPLQAVWYRREPDLRRLEWIGFERTAAAMVEMADLWTALAAHARPAFCAWADPSIASIQRRLIASAGSWWRTLETTPRTLIHNDFNPRNICLRRTAEGPLLCAYDWELATIGAPQRDLAELLCFVLGPQATTAEVRHWIERHRRALERESGGAIDPEFWIEGFRCSLYDVLVDRLSMYALVHRIRRQPFLPRVVRTWRHLYGLFPLPEHA